MRKKKTIIEESLPETNIPENDASDIIIALTKVYKINNGSKSFCFQAHEPVDEVYLQSQYPTGGKFVVYEYNSSNDILNTVHVDIEPKPSTITAINTGQLNGADIQIRMLMDELAWTRQMIITMMGKNNGGSMTELVTALQGLHSIAPSTKDPIDLLVKGMELGARNGGSSGDWKSELLQAAKEILPPAIQAMNMNKQINPNGQQPMMITQTPEMILRQGLAWLKSRIIAGMDTNLAVNWVIQNANDPEYQPILSLAIQGDVDAFIKIDPEISNEPYKSWFVKAITQIKEWYAEQQNQASDDMDGGTGNYSDVTDDETTGTRKPKIIKVV